MIGTIRVGQRLPMAPLAELVWDKVRATPAFTLFEAQRAVIVGAPGAFTPVCSKVHIPKFVEMAGAMKAAGFDTVAVMTSNDPWTLAQWAREIDPEGRLRFLSDGNLAFGEACGLTERIDDLFLGQRLRRFAMTVNRGMVEKLSVERSILDVSCSSADACLLLDA